MFQFLASGSFGFNGEQSYPGSLDRLSHVTADMLCTGLEVDVKHVNDLMPCKHATHCGLDSAEC